VLQTALKQRLHVDIYGTDYPTADGTAVRDYIHVEDLAEAHLRALEHLCAGRESTARNLGTGQGHSVREVIAAAESVSGRAIPAQPSGSAGERSVRSSAFAWHERCAKPGSP
jgi:UDP-glucose 4-epimerase